MAEALDQRAMACNSAAEPGLDEELPKDISLSRLSEFKVIETADEKKFDCPSPWFLALYTASMSMVKSVVVAGAFFFVLAEAEQVTPKCWQWRSNILFVTCTVQAISFWTYPVVCFIFVTLIYTKNLVDMRIYYEFLLHKVIIGFEREKVFMRPTVMALLAYAVFTLSSIVWHIFNKETSAELVINYALLYLAYFTPIFSFLIVLLTQWSIQSQLITLPDFLEDLQWGVQHLQSSSSYSFAALRDGYWVVEGKLVDTGIMITTPQLVSLVAHYASLSQAADEKQDLEADVDAGRNEQLALADKDEDPNAHSDANGGDELDAEQKLSSLFVASLRSEVRHAATTASRRGIYWPLRLLFNHHVQDERARDFRRWTVAYVLSVVVVCIIGAYIFACCTVAALKLEHVIGPDSRWTEYFMTPSDFGQLAPPGQLAPKHIEYYAARLGRPRMHRTVMASIAPG